MYFSVVGDGNQIYKASKLDAESGEIKITAHYNLEMFLSPDQKMMYPVFQLNSLPNYGYFISTSNTYNDGRVW